MISVLRIALPAMRATGFLALPVLAYEN